MSKITLKEIQENIDQRNQSFFDENHYQIQWHVMTYSCAMPIDFIEKNLFKLDVKMICRHQVLTQDFIRKNKDKMDFKAISEFQESNVLTEDFIDEMIDFVDFKKIIANRNVRLTEAFLEKHMSKINKNTLVKMYWHYDDLSETFIIKNKFNPYYVISNQKNISLDYIWNNREKINWENVFCSRYVDILNCKFLEKAYAEGFLYNDDKKETRKELDRLDDLNRLYEDDLTKEDKTELNHLIKKYENRISIQKVFHKISYDFQIKIDDGFLDKYKNKDIFSDFDWATSLMDEKNYSEERILNYWQNISFDRIYYRYEHYRFNKRLIDFCNQLFDKHPSDVYRSSIRVTHENYSKGKEKLLNGFKVDFSPSK